MPEKTVDPDQKAVRNPVVLNTAKDRRRALSRWNDRLWQFFREAILRRRQPATHAYRYFCKLLATEYKEGDECLSIAVSSVGVSPRDVGNTILMLAYSLHQEMEARVLVIDTVFTDLEDTLSKRFRSDQQAGFFQVVQNPDADPRSMVLPTAEEGVFIMPSGIDGSAGFQRQRTVLLERFLQEMGSEYDYLLFLQGDILADTRYMSLAERVGLNLFIAEENRTLLGDLREREALYAANGIEQVRYLLLPA